VQALDHLGNGATGHMLSHPHKRVKLKRNAEETLEDRVTCTISLAVNHLPKPGDLIFEERVGNQVFIGNHFRFRRPYRDTVQTSKTYGDSARHHIRRTILPFEAETKPRPGGRYAAMLGQLTAGRNVFGFVGAKPCDARQPNDALTFGIGHAKDFQQLAGRIAINWAIEQGDLHRDDRFLNQQDQECFVALRPLGQPKPSAVESYLTQNKAQLANRRDLGTLCTYGDTSDDDSAGDLRGRKFYLHQPDAAEAVDPNDPSRTMFEVTGPRKPDWQIGDKGRTITSDKAMLARFISAPGTTFKFTIRFRDLRTWELGALFLTLTADEGPLREFLGYLDPDKQLARLHNWLGSARQKVQAKQPLLALKLGHGRPLGLGSVRIDVKEIRRLSVAEDGWPRLEDHKVSEVRATALKALADKLQSQLGDRLTLWSDGVFLPWLQVHRYAGRKPFDYQRKNGKIFSFHTDLRRQHAEQRKKPVGDSPHRPRPGGLKSLDELDEIDGIVNS
jgi:CRISPR-associated protein (TIGR03986 family)